MARQGGLRRAGKRSSEGDESYQWAWVSMRSSNGAPGRGRITHETYLAGGMTRVRAVDESGGGYIWVEH